MGFQVEVAAVVAMMSMLQGEGKRRGAYVTHLKLPSLMVDGSAEVCHFLEVKQCRAGNAS